MNQMILKCRGCGENIKIQTNENDVTVLAIHSECAMVYAKAA